MSESSGAREFKAVERAKADVSKTSLDKEECESS